MVHACYFVCLGGFFRLVLLCRKLASPSATFVFRVYGVKSALYFNRSCSVYLQRKNDIVDTCTDMHVREFLLAIPR